MKHIKSFNLFESEIEQIPQFDVKKTITVILGDAELSKSSATKFPELNLKKALNNSGLLGRKNIEALKEIYDEICTDPKLKAEYEYVSKKLGESFSDSYNKLVNDFHNLGKEKKEEYKSPYKTMSDEIEDIENSKQFKDWLEELGTPREDTITKEMLISGYCEDLAYYLHYKYGLPVYGVNSRKVNQRNALPDGHWFVKSGNKYYDAMNPKGYEKLSQSVWAIRIKDKHPEIEDSDFDDYVIEDKESIWEVYKDASKIITKIDI